MPSTINKFFNVANTGDDPGTWAPLVTNYNFNSQDGILGGVASIALSAATTITLTLPAGASFTPGAGPSQSENALIKFSGTLTGNAVIKFTMPGFYIVHNACGSATFFSIQLSPASGGGNSIGAPIGRKCHVFFDGTDMDYVDMPEVGSALDLSQSTTVLPKWMTACTNSPYLIKNGAVYNASQYPALAQQLGSTFGGNGVTTFGVPDEMARVRVGLDVAGTGRMTDDVNASVMGDAGGDQRPQNHNHDFTGDAMGNHHHDIIWQSVLAPLGSGGNVSQSVGASGSVRGQTNDASAGTPSGSIDDAFSGDQGNLQPCIVSVLPLIKTAFIIGACLAALNMFPSQAAANTVNSSVAASKFAGQRPPCLAKFVKPSDLVDFTLS